MTSSTQWPAGSAGCLPVDARSVGFPPARGRLWARLSDSASPLGLAESALGGSSTAVGGAATCASGSRGGPGGRSAPALNSGTPMIAASSMGPSIAAGCSQPRSRSADVICSHSPEGEPPLRSTRSAPYSPSGRSGLDRTTCAARLRPPPVLVDEIFGSSAPVWPRTARPHSQRPARRKHLGRGS